jgi:hypothetical protein
VSLPSAVSGKNIPEFRAGPRLRHHIRHRIPPFGVMRRLSVTRRRVVTAIHLRENEPGGVVALLDHVEPRDPGFLDAVRSILNRGLNVIGHAVRFHMNVHVNDEHKLYHRLFDFASNVASGCCVIVRPKALIVVIPQLILDIAAHRSREYRLRPLWMCVLMCQDRVEWLQ